VAPVDGYDCHDGAAADGTQRTWGSKELSGARDAADVMMARHEAACTRLVEADAARGMRVRLRAACIGKDIRCSRYGNSCVRLRGGGGSDSSCSCSARPRPRTRSRRSRRDVGSSGSGAGSWSRILASDGRVWTLYGSCLSHHLAGHAWWRQGVPRKEVDSHAAHIHLGTLAPSKRKHHA
jgi:hypothetical protein